MNNVLKNKYGYTFVTALLTLLLGLASSTQADTCLPSYIMDADTVQLPCVDWLSDPASRVVYKANLLVEDKDALLFKWADDKTVLSDPSADVGAVFNASNNNLYIPTINVQTSPGVTQDYQVTLQENASGLLYITAIEPLPTTDNSRPTATSFSIAITPDDLTNNNYQQIQLKGKDNDNDTIAFEFLATSSGSGYDLAYIDPTSYIMYVVIKDQFFGTIELPYRVSDGKTFSNPATVTMTVEVAATDSSLKLGSQRVESREFAGYYMQIPDTRSYPESSSNSESESTLPNRIDLSDKFPTPQDQGEQSSCVGWATAYVKTYQEALEIGWSLINDEEKPIFSRIFSPAFIYNQINGNSDYGSKISDALDLVVNKGAATLKTMPYESSFGSYLTQPSDDAKTEAENFKADNWGALGSEDDIKTSLASKKPVIVSMAVFDTFKNLKGSNSVYNTEGTYLGDHAVTIVGYDDSFEGGGAYKIINSWGTEWGDEGFFWLPYDFLSTEITINGED